MDKFDLYLQNELKKMLAANGKLQETINSFNANSSPKAQRGMICLILGKLREPREENFLHEGIEVNNILLEVLRNLKSAGCEVEKPLEDYCSRIHKLEGIRDEKGNLREAVKQHLILDVGSTLVTCKRRSYPVRKISLTSWRRSL